MMSGKHKGDGAKAQRRNAERRVRRQDRRQHCQQTRQSVSNHVPRGIGGSLVLWIGVGIAGVVAYMAITGKL
jgi:hypothetical protein